MPKGETFGNPLYLKPRYHRPWVESHCHTLGSGAKGSAVSTGAKTVAKLTILRNHRHPNPRLLHQIIVRHRRAHLEDPEVLLGQIPKVHPLVRLEIECQLPSIPAVLRQQL